MGGTNVQLHHFGTAICENIFQTLGFVPSAQKGIVIIMDVKWTPEQRMAIDLESGKGNILVSAAAGSGKTAVLVE